MGTVARGAKTGGGTNLNPHQTGFSSEVNTDFNTLYTLANGEIDDANIHTGELPGAKSLRFTEISAPSSPSSDDILLYAADSGGVTLLYQKDSGGVTVPLGALYAEESAPATSGLANTVRLYALTGTPSTRLSTVDPAGMALDVSGVFSRSVGNPFKDVNTTTSEVSIFSSVPSIKGNTLGTSRIVRCTILGDALHNIGGAARGFTLKVKYGGTTGVNAAMTAWYATGATRFGWRAQVDLAALGATNAQYMSSLIDNAATAGVSGTMVLSGFGGSSPFPIISTHTTLAEDSTADKNFDITITPEVNSASLSIRVFSVVLELL